MEKSVLVPFDCKISFSPVQLKFAVSFLMNQFIALLPFTFVGIQRRNEKWLEPFLLVGLVLFFGGESGQVVGCWSCNPEVPGSNPPPCHEMDLSLVAPNSTPPGCVNSQLVRLSPVGVLNLCLCLTFIFCLKCTFDHIYMEFARYKC